MGNYYLIVYCQLKTQMMVVMMNKSNTQNPLVNLWKRVKQPHLNKIHKNLQKSSSKLNHANEGENIFLKEQHVDKPSFPRRERATVLMAENIRHIHRQDEYTKYTTTSSQPIKSKTND